MDYDAHDDAKPQAEYLAWTENWLGVVRECLTGTTGSLWLFMSPKLVSEVDVIAKKLGLYKRSQIVWHYTFGVNSPRNFTPSSTHILYYTQYKGKFTFNADAIKVPSARQVKYNDKRAKSGGRLPNDAWVLFPEQLPQAYDPAGEVWLQSRVCGTFHERVKVSPNQLPLPLVERIIKVSSHPGQLVLDPFCGTGTTAVACAKLGRRCLTTDVSKACVEEATCRLAKFRRSGEEAA
jgi:site-specific DNA-methyltransferase (adenine-specific)